MRVIDSLDQIRSQWIRRASQKLARGERVRHSFLDQMEKYHDLLRQAIISGDSEWLNEILDQWTAAQTLSDREQDQISMAPILTEIVLSISEVAQENLRSDDALELTQAILPLHTHALVYTSRQESDIYVQHIANELGKARMSLERLDKSKSDFIAVAAHELKTPLTLIDGYASMLEAYFSEEDEEDKFVLLNGIQTGINRLQQIISDMIDVSLIDNDLLQLNFQPVWINQLLDIAKEDLAKFAKHRDLEFIFEEFPGCRRQTYGDPERLYQAFWNLLTNAVKYTPDGGTITVSGRELPGFLEVTITDTGIGIAPENQEQIFEKFAGFRNIDLHSSSKTNFKGGGPGLGLPITRGIIEAHGGTLWVESEGHDEKTCPGATFHALIPLREESPNEKTKRFLESQRDFQAD
jgi:signal transduction histidine kinase